MRRIFCGGNKPAIGSGSLVDMWVRVTADLTPPRDMYHCWHGVNQISFICWSGLVNETHQIVRLLIAWTVLWRQEDQCLDPL